MATVAGAQPVQTNLENHLIRIALEQCSLFLTTPEAAGLARACHDLNSFLKTPTAECRFWNVCQLERAKFRQGLIWLHPIASLEDAARFAVCARSLRLRGNATFTDQGELRSLTHILQTEATYADRVGRVVDTFGKRFLLAWKFDLAHVVDLLENRSLLEVVSDDVIFNCRYGISFALNLTVSKASLQSSCLTFRLNSVRMVNECRSKVEIKACGSIVAPDPQRSVVKLKPIFGGTRSPQSPTIVEDDFDDGDPDSLDQLVSTEWRHFSRLLSVVRLHLAPVSLTVAPISLIT